MVQLSRRIIAFTIDYILVIVPYCIVLYAASVWLNEIFDFHSILTDSRFMFFVPYLFVTFPVTMYFAISESSRWSSSAGKKIIGLKVISGKNPPLLSQAFKRNFLKFIPWEIGHQIALLAAFDLVSIHVVWPYLLMTLIIFYIISNMAYYFLFSQYQTLYDRWTHQSVILKSESKYYKNNS